MMTPVTDNLVAILQIASVLASAVFGGIGVLTEYKDKDGRPTRWGRIALAGIICSALLTLLLQAFEASRARAASAEAARRDAETRKNLSAILASASRITTATQQNLTAAQQNLVRSEQITK